MKKLFSVLLVLTIVLSLSGCNTEGNVTNIEQVQENQLVSYRYIDEIDAFQIKFFKDETYVDWLIINVYRNKVEIIEMKNSEEVDVFTEIDLNIPYEGHYFDLTLFYVNELQYVSYDSVLSGLE